MDRMGVNNNIWENQGGWLMTVNGTKVGKIVGDKIELYDKKAKIGIPFSIEDFKRVINTSNDT